MERYLDEELKKYGESDMYPLHMPGHKRQIALFDDPFSIDITEIEGFDNLHHPEGILLEAQQRAAALYGADETYFLINGSTAGILSAVAAATKKGGLLAMARDSHKSAYHAAMQNDLQVRWIYPGMDKKRGIRQSVTPEQVEEAMTDEVQAVLITSPTYDGVISDIKSIAEIVHAHDAVLIVDEAHGAHLKMHPYFPASALDCGADLVIHSLHKTLPSLTQTALLHVKGDRVNRARLRQYLDIYQSSSPSYVLMSSIDACIRLMVEKGPALFDSFTERLEELRTNLGRMRTLHLVTGEEPELSAFAFDKSKILISTERSGYTGPELAGTLREKYHLETEMAARQYVTAILTCADTQDGMDRLKMALYAIDLEQKSSAAASKERQGGEDLPHPVTVMGMAEAQEAPQRAFLIKESCGRISAEFVYAYPPGIPLLVPGEEIPDELPGLLEEYRAEGLSVQGPADLKGEEILCVEDCSI